MNSDNLQYLFLCVQPGAESAIKEEIAATWPNLRFAFSRTGFLTFKVAEGRPFLPGFDLKSTFARTYGFSIGRVEGDGDAAKARLACRIAAGMRFDQIHIWHRETMSLTDSPLSVKADSPLALDVAQEAVAAELCDQKIRINRRARTGDAVLDIIIIDDQLWWVGWHQASSHILRQPGGLFPVDQLPEHAVSRAYLKMQEALMWSQLPLQKGDRCVEIGSAPGGACQALLERQLLVTGIDPSEMHPTVLASPNFTHIKKRGSDLKRPEYATFKWLMTDANILPDKTLAMLESIATHASVRLDGMLITLKLPDWSAAAEIPEYLRRIRSWGFKHVRARQLRHNRQEICVAAVRSKTLSRLRHQRKKSGKRHDKR
ncbi:MAG: hypothetical protein KDA87_08040 [Planctomycetales bacterium]|nr:hypothetical protein [Planctomycetales bacterium]